MGPYVKSILLKHLILKYQNVLILFPLSFHKKNILGNLLHATLDIVQYGDVM